MAPILMKNNVYWVGVSDPEPRFSDIDMTTDIGTRINPYLIKGSEKIALIEVCESYLFDQYLDNVKRLANLSEVDYLIINHTEPDHSEAVGKLIELLPNLTVLGSHAALAFLRKKSNKKFKSQEVIDGDQLQLGDKTLRFMNVPFLKWPDTIYYLFGRGENDLMARNFLIPFKECFD